MRLIKVILIGLLSLAGLFIIISELLPGTYRVERSILIKASPSLVFNEINDFKNMDHWSPWKNYDHFMQTSIVGTPDKPGYKLSWESENKKVGHGSSRRIKAKENEFIINDIFFEDYGVISKESWKIEDTTEQRIKLSWINEGDIAFMFRIPLNIVTMEKIMSPDFEKGLKNMKAYCENKANAEPDSGANQE